MRPEYKREESANDSFAKDNSPLTFGIDKSQLLAKRINAYLIGVSRQHQEVLPCE